MKYIFSIFFLFPILINSCTDGIKSNLKQYNDKTVEYYTLYKRDNINDAEEAIRRLISLTEHYKKNNLINGYRYDESLAFDYTRLYFIQKEKGSLDDAEISLDKAIGHFMVGKRYDPTERDKYKDIIITLVNELDDNAEIKTMWKKKK